MVSNKEILIQALETYSTKTIDKLFGVSSLPAQALIKYGVRNMVDKYGVFLDVFTDKEGKLNVPMIFDALLGELKARGGVSFWNIRFTETDLQEITSIYQDLLKYNECQKDPFK